MYKKILNPENGNLVSVKSKKGKKILENYSKMYLQQGKGFFDKLQKNKLKIASAATGLGLAATALYLKNKKKTKTDISKPVEKSSPVEKTISIKKPEPDISTPVKKEIQINVNKSSEKKNCSLVENVVNLKNKNEFKGAENFFKLGDKYKIKTGNHQSKLGLESVVNFHEWIEIYSKKYDCIFSMGLISSSSDTIIQIPDLTFSICHKKINSCMKETGKKEECIDKCTNIVSIIGKPESKVNSEYYTNFSTLFEGRLNYPKLKILDIILKKALFKKIGKNKDINTLRLKLPEHVTYSLSANSWIFSRKNWNNWLSSEPGEVANCHTFTNDFHHTPVSLYKTLSGKDFNKSMENEMSELEKKVIRLRLDSLKKKLQANVLKSNKSNKLRSVVGQVVYDKSKRDLKNEKTLYTKHINDEGKLAYATSYLGRQ